MKKLLSVLLCMAMLVPMLGAAAPLDEAEELHLCETCLELDCQVKDGQVQHAKDCACAPAAEDADSKEAADNGKEDEDGEKDEAGKLCPCACETCAAPAPVSPDKGSDEDGGARVDTVGNSAGEDDTAAGSDAAPVNGSLPADESGITVSGGQAYTDYLYSDGTLDVRTDTPLTISGSAASTLKVKSNAAANVNLTLENLSITAAGDSALDLFEAGAVTLTLKGANTLRGGDGGAGIRPPRQNILIISGGGSLDASGGDGGAGIGGEADEDSGAVSINGGTVTARGGAGAAGIGAGRGADRCGSIVIEGGDVTAIGSPALGVAPMFRSYGHLTYGNTDAAAGNTPVEWSGNYGNAQWYTYQWVRVLSMTVDSLEVSPDAVSLKPGETQDFSAVLNITAGGEAAELDVTELAQWTLDQTGGGSQIGEQTGKLTVGAGETAEKLTVTASYQAAEYPDKPIITGSAVVTVTASAPTPPPAAVKVTLDKSEAKLGVGDDLTLKATVEPADSTEKVSWSVDREGIVKLDQNGKITALKAGTVTVTVKAGESAAACTVTVYAKKYTITFDPNGGACNTKTATTRDDGTLATLPEASKQGLYFAHWYTKKEGGIRVYTTTVFNEDTTLYARWSTSPVTGDENNIGLWAALLGVSALAVCAGAVVVFRKARKKKDQ